MVALSRLLRGAEFYVSNMGEPALKSKNGKSTSDSGIFTAFLARARPDQDRVLEARSSFRELVLSLHADEEFPEDFREQAKQLENWRESGVIASGIFPDNATTNVTFSGKTCRFITSLPKSQANIAASNALRKSSSPWCLFRKQLKIK